MAEELRLILDGQDVPVKVRRNARAKKMILRVCSRTGDVRLTLPTRVRLSAAEDFVLKHTSWLVAERGKLISTESLGDGDRVSFRGQPHTIRFLGSGGRTVTLQDGQLLIGGPADMAPSRLEKWLKAEARIQLNARAQYHAGALDVVFARVSIGDMRSRWGSCSSRGTLRFNWRLIMAPDAVLDYVAAHEVAHLLEMNHSDRFWAHVERCVPDYRAHRRWLRSDVGAGLMSVSFG
ncbi:M48 family metallopeptidase [Kordiimonas marina]|uniref:M48 family metallopeptidase n=1 Tax=Kordiimonas marina TaxID=2872312 RepID=UPI001FF1B101|nr:SprT family zinc-dependent metalloprotease [Kordiimonas marina]MCJ9428241.1 M48 family metallopeptidase [Kordiimonas marina]